MICQRCHQRPATVFFSQTVGNQTTQAHLCEVCAREQGEMSPFGLNPFAAFSDLLNSFMDWGGVDVAEVQSGRVAPDHLGQQMQCPHCGYQLSTFRQNGRLGCTKCYTSFKTALGPLIASIHGNARHQDEADAAHAPSSDPSDKTADENSRPGVQVLRAKLKLAIQNEKFEEAAQLRDEIKKLEGKTNGI